MDEAPKIKPQPGPQTDFLATLADIAIFGGAAGGGKSYALLIEPLRHYNNPRFGGVIFRRNSTQVRNEGGLWDQSMEMYSQLHGHPREAFLEWVFPCGSRVKFAHLEQEITVYNWQGSQVPYIGFDELVHFTERQFTYMLSRNRSMSGVPGYIRATCNPDSDSWVRKWVDWYIGIDGYPIKERSGVLRWFTRKDDEIIWSDTKDSEDAKSFTFIPSSIYDNKLLLARDPSYLSNLKALSRVERLRLLEGNWNVRPSAGMYFQRTWFEVIDAIPDYEKVIRYWDRAATCPSEANTDPDWSAGCKVYKLRSGQYLVADMRRMRESPLKVEQFVKNTASFDGNVPIGIEEDPGSAGVADSQNYARVLAGYDVRIRKPTKNKETRARPVSAQCEAGNVKVLRGPWNDAFFNELENFPEGAHDDQVDALSGAFNELTQSISLFDAI